LMVPLLIKMDVSLFKLNHCVFSCTGKLLNLVYMLRQFCSYKCRSHCCQVTGNLPIRAVSFVFICVITFLSLLTP
jgi:hypothetical protein